MDLISRVISEETDYECRIGRGYFVILPKGNPSVYGMALSKREFRYPDAASVASGFFLEEIKCVDGGNSTSKLMLMGISSAYCISGAISIKAGEDKGFVILSEIAPPLGSASLDGVVSIHRESEEWSANVPD